MTAVLLKSLDYGHICGMETLISTLHFKADEKLVGFIHQLTGALEKKYQDIFEIEVFLKPDITKRTRKNLCRARLVKPGKNFVVRK